MPVITFSQSILRKIKEEVNKKLIKRGERCMFYKNEGEYAKELSDTGRKQNLKIGVNYISNTIKGYGFNVLYKPDPLVGIYASHIHFRRRIR